MIIILCFVCAGIWGQAKGIRIPFQWVNNHIYLRGYLNDSLPAWILLDCGAPTLLSERQAKQATLKTKPLGEAEGIGNALAPVSVTDSVSFTIGSLRYVENTVPVLALDQVEHCAAEIEVAENGAIKWRKEKNGKVQPIDAILGNKFFLRFVIEVDHHRKHLTLFEPSSYQYTGKGNRVPIEYIEDHVYIMASLPGSGSIISGRFMVDCGSVTGLVLNVPFIEKHQLKPGSDSTTIAVCGIGGYSGSIMSRIDYLWLGAFKIDRPVTLFSRATGGVLTKPGVAGSIGNGILRNFKVTYHYAKSELILDKQAGRRLVRWR